MWFYYFIVVVGGSSVKVGIVYEQFIGKLMDGEGDLDLLFWRYFMLCYSKDGLYVFFIILFFEVLQMEVFKFFKFCQFFINVLVEVVLVDYYVFLVQIVLQVCLVYFELQSEIYC